MKVLKERSYVELNGDRMIGRAAAHFRGCCAWTDFHVWVTTTDFFPLLCTLALGLSSVNFVRVAGDVARLGAPYLLLYSGLSLLLGLPVALLELGLGQFSQQGAAALWRAVPALRGVAFVKLTCAGVYALCTGVHAAVVGAYAVRTGAANLPMSQCSQLTMTEHGYFQNNTFGLECAMRTFLTPYEEEPFWFSIMCITIFIVWIIVPVCLYSLEAGLKCSVSALASVTCILLCVVVVAIGRNNLWEIFEDPQWSEMGTSRLWFAAVWQVLLSSRLGLAYLDTAAGSVYFRSHSIRWAFVLAMTNLITGWLGVLIWFSLSFGIERDTSVLAVPLWIYDSAVQNEVHRAWSCLAFIAMLCATVSAMMTFLYPVFDSLCKTFKYKWRLPAMVMVALAMAFSMAMFVAGLEVITFLERFAVPLVTCLVLVVEMAAFLFIYGWSNVRSDLEFMLGNRICVGWICWWLLAAVSILGVSIWELYSIVADDWPWSNGSALELGLLAALAAVAAITVVVWAALVIIQQDEYDSLLKIKSSFNPSRKWGPVEPILRHLWIQWTSNPHSPDIAAQVHTHRRGVTANTLHEGSATHSHSSASRKSSLEEYESRKSSLEDYGGSKKSSENRSSKISSLEEIGGSKRSSLEHIQSRASKLSSDKFSNRSSRMSSLGVIPARDESEVMPSSDRNTAPYVQDNVYYGQIRQMHY